MAMVCPQCSEAFEGKIQCPKCKVGLRYQAPRTVHMSAPLPPPAKRWHQTPMGRVLVGAVIAVGMSYGLLQLSVTLMKPLGKTGSDALKPPVALGVFYGLQVVAVFIGGLLSGVATRKGFSLGATVGLLSGGIALGAILSGVAVGLVEPFSSNLLNTGKPANPVELAEGVPMHVATLYGLPVVHLLCGAMGGLFGGLLFRPAPELGAPVLLATESAVPAVGLSTNINLPSGRDEKPSLFKGPIAWVRCLVGIGFAVFVGVFGPKPIQRFVEVASEGALKVADNQQDYVTVLEIFALAIFIGGAIAGAACHNGLKQGLIVGFGAGVAMIPFIATAGQNPLYIVLSAIFIAPLGGWFGSSLLPPAPPPRYTQGALD